MPQSSRYRQQLPYPLVPEKMSTCSGYVVKLPWQVQARYSDPADKSVQTLRGLVAFAFPSDDERASATGWRESTNLLLHEVQV